MKKTFCDRCGVECNGQSVQRFTIFDVNRAIDVCENCYSEFFRWLNSGKDVVKDRPIGDVNEFIKKSLGKDSDDSDGLDEFIKDAVSGENCLDGGCNNCYYIDKKYFDYPCRECTRCNVNNGYVKADHFVKGDENNEN